MQGCVTNSFPQKRFFDAIREVPDAERVIDQTTIDTRKVPPYRTLR
ncbi:putative uncharacterized protein (plasmid) [Caballeronia insecticola]|uniref:Uncharacterized protein n=1 Tax=Caballeronia insecticola TaxID=758793 RepID=R4X5H4_9BURK|nr:putative uncharacterized protein [Caballeronia insecticola]